MLSGHARSPLRGSVAGGSLGIHYEVGDNGAGLAARFILPIKVSARPRTLEPLVYQANLTRRDSRKR